MKTFLEARFGTDDLIEIRAIRAGHIRRFWTTLAGLASVMPELQQLNANGWDIYVGVNPRSGRRSDELGVSKLVALHVDVDLQEPSTKTGDTDCSAIENPSSKGIAARIGTEGFVLPECFFEAEPRMEASPLPAPSMTVDSGHGRHLYWILQAPVVVSDANREQLKRINRGLALAVGGDAACSDLGRILRVPGLSNHKQLPPAEVRLLSSTGLRYTVEDLEPFAAKIATRSVAVGLPLPSSIPPVSPELEQRFKAVRRSNGEISRSWRGEIGDGSSDSRFVLVKKLREAGFTPEEILAIVCSRRWFNCRTKRVRPAGSVLRDTTRLIAKNHAE